MDEWVIDRVKLDDPIEDILADLDALDAFFSKALGEQNV